jgi:divalent metal cation (Fe/Co/Zn/Cd) transporter
MENTKQRPGAVTTATVLQILTVVFAIITVVLSLKYNHTVEQAVRDELIKQGATPKDADTGSASAVGSGIGTAIGLAIPVFYAILGFLNLGGRNWSRIVTWVLSGLTLACSVLGLGATALLSNMGGGGNSKIDVAKAVKAGMDAVPGWYSAYQLVSSIISIVIALAVIILLALPASNAFFRKRPPQAQLPPEAFQQ